MPYIIQIRHMIKIALRKQDPEVAEGLWLEGTWLNDNGEYEDARLAFRHACLLDKKFGGAYYNYAALTERLTGESKETLKAWEAYLPVAEEDSRQARATIEKVRGHVEDLRKKVK